MVSRITQLLLIGIFFTGCSTDISLLENASVKYKRNKEYASLEVIYRHLSKGMQRNEVERLLGEADYSPTNGQYYYSSNKSASIEGRSVPVGLVLQYRDTNDMVTTTLQRFWMGPIGE